MRHETVLRIQGDSRATIATILCEEFDFQLTNQFRTEVGTATGGDATTPLILDLTNVGYMPSLTLGALVEIRNRFAREKRAFTLVGMQPAIVKLMQASGMLSLFDIRNNIADAMNPSSTAQPTAVRKPE